LGKPADTREYLKETIEGLDIYVSRRLEIGDKGFRIVRAGIFFKRLEVDGVRII
jgi:hypothetical protein